jgi:hypothetical protein
VFSASRIVLGNRSNVQALGRGASRKALAVHLNCTPFQEM